MLCFRTLTQLAAWPTALVRGVVLLERLRLVSLWFDRESETVYITTRNWLPRGPQRGSTSTEYALLIATAGAFVWVSWFTLVQAVTELFRETMRQFAGATY